MNVIWPGEPGKTWENSGEKIVYQFICSWSNTCGACAQYHLAIAKWWPKIHHGCNCQSKPIYPGAESRPYEDWRQIVEQLPDDQKRALVGASLWKLLDAKEVKWEDVVTSSRVRLLREVVSRNRIEVSQMTRAGVSERIATNAFASVNTPAHQIAQQTRAELVNQIQQLGVQPQHLAEMFGERMASRVGIAGGPSKASPMPTAGFRSDADWTKILVASFRPIVARAALAAMTAKPEPLPAYGESKATVTGFEDNPEKLADAIDAAGKILGRNVTAANLASIAGAPNNATVRVETIGSDVLIAFEADGIQATRRLRIGKDGKPEIYNAALYVRDRGKGIGAEILGRQIEQAADLGIARMKVAAAGNPELAALKNDGLVIGFKVWPKFGYDGPISDEQRKALPEKLRDAKTIGELYRTKAGREAWAKHGSDLDLIFDLTPGSYSQRVWKAYREEKARDARRTKPEG